MRAQRSLRLWSIFGVFAAAGLWGAEPAGVPEKLAFVGSGGRVMVRSEAGTRQVAAGPAMRVAWSPDGGKVAFVERADLYQQASVVLRVASETGNSLATVAVPQGSWIDDVELSWRDLDQLTWLDADRLALAGSYDPSNDVLAVVDLKAGKAVRAWIGREFSWSPSRAHVAAVGWIPHAVPEEARAHDRIEIDGKVVYPAKGAEKSTGKIRGPLLWAPDGRSLAFLETRGQELLLVFLTTEGAARTYPLAAGSKPVAWASDGDALLLKTGQGYAAVENATGKQVELPEKAALDRFPALAGAKHRQEIEKSVGASTAAWWPADPPKTPSPQPGNKER